MEMKYTKTMKIFLFPAIFFAVFFIFGNEAKAADYYVSPSGSDNSTTGSESAPFKTIQKAADIINPGDTVIVKDGVYTATSGARCIFIVNNKNGSPDKWITFKSENKYGAVLDGGTGDINSTFAAIALLNSSYIRIEGFEIKDTSWGGIVIDNSNHLVYYGMKIHDIGRYQMPCGSPNYEYGHSAFGGTNSAYLTIDSNIIYSIGRLPSGCNYDNNHDHMTYMHVDYVTIVNNIMYNQTAGWIIYIGGTKGWRVINNTFHGPNPEPDYYHGHVKIMGNATDIEIKNNISYLPATCFIWVTWSNYVAGTVVIENNLVYGTNEIIICTDTNPPGCYSYSGNIIGQDPLFVDEPNKDFHLQSGSPAINAGIYAGVDYDIKGNLRDENPDIGAYEYAGAQTDTTAPAAPAGLTVQ